MEYMDETIKNINKILKKQTFNVETSDFNCKVKFHITGEKEYISVGEKTKHLQYVLYILPSGNEDSDMFYSIMARQHGRETQITTHSRIYWDIMRPTTRVLQNFLKYFSIDEPVICVKIINLIKPYDMDEIKKINEGRNEERRLDVVTRKLVQDIIQFFKYQREGEFDLPEDLGEGEMVYNYPGFDGFSISLDLELDDEIEGIDVDADLYYDDDMIIVKIISNPNAGYTNLSELTDELNEVLRHEIEHIKQHSEGYKFPKKEPKSPEKYYTQQHELDAQRAGFKKKAKSTGTDFETLVRNWFEKNPHKHKLNQIQKEKVIQKILDTK